MAEPKPHADEQLKALAAEATALRARLISVEQEERSASPARRSELGWLRIGAKEHLARLGAASRAVRDGRHEFIMHMIHDGQVSALCSCGALIPGRIGEDVWRREVDNPGHRA